MVVDQLPLKGKDFIVEVGVAAEERVFPVKERGVHFPKATAHDSVARRFVRSGGGIYHHCAKLPHVGVGSVVVEVDNKSGLRRRLLTDSWVMSHVHGSKAGVAGAYAGR